MRCSFAFVSVTLGAIILASAADDGREKLTRLTATRIITLNQMADCRAPSPPSPHDGEAPFVHLYANDAALEYRRNTPDSFEYPIGSIFRKEKYKDAKAKAPDLATIMTRVGNKGTVEDWEFRMITLPDGKEVTGIRKKTCADCHSKYEKRGFVSRDTETALREKLKLKAAPPSTNDADEDRRLFNRLLRPPSK